MEPMESELEKVAWFQYFALLLIKKKTKFCKQQKNWRIQIFWRLRCREQVIRILFACKRRNRFFPSTATNNSFVSFYILKHFSAQSVSVSIICWTLFQIFISTSWNTIVKKEGIPTLRGFVGSTLMTFEGLNSPRGHSTLRTELNKNWDLVKKTTKYSAARLTTV